MEFSLKQLDDTNHTFVIAEAGSNWKCGNFDEDVNQAKKLIEIASNAGADAIKFQTFRADTTYVSNAGSSDYLSNSGLTKNITDIFENMSMPYEMIPILVEHCKKSKIIFMSSPFSVQDAKQIDPYVLLHKVSSFEINHVRLLEFLESTKKPVLISTGASTFDEIDYAVNLFKKNQNEEICLLQCTSKYPAPLKSLNLSVISKIKERYNLPVGFSDHSINPIVGPLTAIGFGATIIEKHFTLDKNLPGPDHSFALNPKELKQMIQMIRDADQSKGNGKKIILDEEKDLFDYAKRSIQAIKDISKGEVLKEGININILRSGKQKKGVSPQLLNKINGKKALKHIKLGEGITDSMF